MTQATTESKKEDILISWQFNDLAGNVITIRPWSLLQTDTLFNVIGEILSDIREHTGSVNFDAILSDFPEFFITKYSKPLCKVIYITAGRDADWLANLDIPLGLEVLDVIFKQNFTGDRVKRQLDKWLVRVPKVAPAPKEPLDRQLPGLTS